MMEYRYIGKTNDAEGLTSVFKPKAVEYFKKWIESIIFAGQPYLAEDINVEKPDEETLMLLKFCRFFSAVLTDKNPELLDINEWNLEFEGKHHALVGMYLNFIDNIYNIK